MRSRKLAVLLLSALLVSAAVAAASSKPTVKSLGDALICQCGCNQTVNECNHYQCPSRAEMRAMMAKEIAAGKGETAILQDFVLKYGVKVLASPPTQGFNITVWILPGIGLLAGLGLVIFVVKHWRRQPEAAAAAPAPIDPKVLEAMEEEMKRVARS
jgi:cytochrome c-type biogenesis protein CcmH